jgi:translation elongation factor EF-Tu-like GTPase
MFFQLLVVELLLLGGSKRRVKVGEEIEIVGLGESKKTTCTGVEMFRKELGQGQAGDNVGILVRGIEKDEIQSGTCSCKPGSIKPHTKAKAQIYVLIKKKAEGTHLSLRATARSFSLELPT